MPTTSKSILTQAQDAALLGFLRTFPQLEAAQIDRIMQTARNGGGDSADLAPLDLDRCVTFADAEKITRRHRRTLRNWAHQGALRFVYGAGGRAIGVSADSLRSFMQRGKPDGATVATPTATAANA